MDDSVILDRIGSLVDEEQHLREMAGSAGLDPEQQRRLDAVEVSLDQCWDLLRRRRAARKTGGDPDRVSPADPETVEDYLQ